MADQTIVIEVVSEFKDNASSGISRVKNATDQTSSSAERLNGSMNKLKRQIASATGVGSGSGVGGTSTGVLQKLKAINAEARRLNGGSGSFISKVRNFGQAIRNIGGQRSVLQTLGGFAKKGLTIPIRILDKATAPLRGLYRGLTSFRGIVTGMAANWAFQKGVINPIKQADQLTNAKTFFAMKFGGQRQANAFMKDVYAFDKKSPYDTGQIIQVAKTMLGYGWGRKNVLRDLGTIEDAAAAHGAGNEGVSGIMRQLAQTRMRLKPSQEDINVLNSYGVDAWKYIAQGLGLKGNAAGKAKAREMVQAKGSNVLSGEEATNLILKGLRRDFNGAAQKQVEKTAGGMLDKISGELNTKLVVPWGQGLQKGAIKGLKVIDSWINDHEGSVDKFGQKLKKVSQKASVGLATKATEVIDRVNKVTSSKKFKKSDLAGKTSMIVKAVFFGKDGIAKAGAQLAKQSGKIGLGIAKGFISGVGDYLSDALTALPGGKKKTKSAGSSALTLGVLGGTLLLHSKLARSLVKFTGKQGFRGIKSGTGKYVSWLRGSANPVGKDLRSGRSALKNYKAARQYAQNYSKAVEVEKGGRLFRSPSIRGYSFGGRVTEGVSSVARESRFSRVSGGLGKAVDGLKGLGEGSRLVKGLSGASKAFGKIATPLALMGTGIHLFTAKNKTKAVSEEAGSWGGALAGGKLGAMAGSFAGPVGTIVGMLGGGALGMFGGSKVGKWAGGKISRIFGGSSKSDPLRNLLGLGKGSKKSEKAAKDLGKDFKSAGKSAKSAGKGFKSAGKAAKSGSKGFKSAGKAAKSGSKGFKSAGKAAKSAGKSFKSAGKSAKTGAKGFKSAGKAAKSGSKGFKVAGKNAKSSGSKFKAAGNNAKTAGSKMKSAGAKVQALGAKATGAGAKLTAMGSRASAAASNLSAFSSAVSQIASAASGLAAKIASIHVPSTVGKGHARGTSSASPGLKLVGEEGPELLQFRGGEKVYTAAQTRHMLRRAGNRRTTTASGVHVNVGNITINATGDAAGFEALIPQLSNRIAHEVAREAGRIYQNTPIRSA